MIPIYQGYFDVQLLYLKFDDMAINGSNLIYRPRKRDIV